MANDTLLFMHPDNYTSVTGVFIDYPSQVLFPGNTFGYMLILLFGSISFLASDADVEESFALSSFVMLITAIGLRVLNAIGDYGFLATALVFLLAVYVNGPEGGERL